MSNKKAIGKRKYEEMCRQKADQLIKKSEDITFGEVEKYTEMIPLSNLSQSAKQQIQNLVFRYNYEQYGKETLVYDNWFLIGSFGYKQQKYWGDMDLRENIVFCCDEGSSVRAFIFVIRKIIQRYINNDKQWFKELKCGIDDRYSFVNPKEYFSYLTIDNFTDDQIKDKIKKLLSEKAIDKLDYEEILRLLKVPKRKEKEYKCARERILEIFRKYYIVRWNASEVLNGHKMLYGNYRLDLVDAIRAKQAINLECIAIINNQLLDVSNFYVLTYMPYPEFAGLGKLPDKPLNEISYDAITINYNQLRFSDFYGHSISSLTDSIETLLFSCRQQDGFKAMKRMWSLSRTILNYSEEPDFINFANDILKRIVLFISSDTSNLNNIKNGIAVIVGLIEDQVPFFPYKLSLQQIKTMKNRIGKITFIPNEELENTFNPALDAIYDALMDKDYETVIDLGNNFTKSLANIINERAMEYLEFVDLYPTFRVPAGFKEYIDIHDPDKSSKKQNTS